MVCFAAGAARADSCLINPGQPQISTVTTFVADPKGALIRFPDGGGAMVSFVRNLVATDPSTTKPLFQLLQSMNAEQRAALGSGLALAATLCAPRLPNVALDIQQGIVQANSPEFTAAFAGVIGDVQTTAISAGGPATTGATGGGGPVGNGAGQNGITTGNQVGQVANSGNTFLGNTSFGFSAFATRTRTIFISAGTGVSATLP